MKSLYDELKKYEQSDFYGFHMPGHKRNGGLTGAALPYGIDITEIDGFDDLHHAKGIFKRNAGTYGKSLSCGRDVLDRQRKHCRYIERDHGMHKTRRRDSYSEKLS